MKHQIKTLLTQAISSLKSAAVLPDSLEANIQITHTKDKSHGDFACNIALMLAKPAGKNPRELAQQLVAALPENSAVEKVEIAGPGFINFFLSQSSTLSVIDDILKQQETYGLSNIGAGRKVQVEFVSANPTGPLHVGHGRGAAYGATVADLLEAVGFEVHREYYVNDAGRQMDILATSVWLRYLQCCEIDVPFPSNGYQGDYVLDIANSLLAKHDKNLAHPVAAVMEDIPDDEPAGGDKEKHIDALILRCKILLGDDSYLQVFDEGLNTIINDIREDLEGFGVHYDNWYSERSLSSRNLIKQAIDRLQKADLIYKDKGALWFKSTEFGDEKDRVVVRDNGQTTYFASDIAYHMDKLERGFDRVIDVWGSDHHGYVPRVKAALKALGDDADKLDVLLVQFAVLYRGGEKMQMSTRSGSFVTLRELREEVGSDAARFFYVMRKCEQHMDFDLDLAKSQTKDNPIFYIQYAHARICSVFRQLAEKKMAHDIENGMQNLAALVESHESSLLNMLSKFSEIVEKSALNEEPHQLAHYLKDLATDLHKYYDSHKVIIDDSALRDARLNLLTATRHVLKNGLKLLGVSAPEKM